MDLEQHERELLRRARRGLSPTAGDESRVLAATLAAGAPLGGGTSSADTASAAARQKAVLARYFAGILALGVAGVIGYGWGYRAGSTARSIPAVAPPATTAKSPPTTEHSPVVTDEAPTETTRDVGPTRELRRAADSSARPKALTPLGSSSASAPELGLDEEVRQLRRIERAIRDGNPRLALVLAEELDRALPGGQLSVERHAASLMASCQLDSDGAGAQAARFVAENPASPYAARLSELCKLPRSEQRK